jgi:YedE family putative selenium metabolism protein
LRAGSAFEPVLPSERRAFEKKPQRSAGIFRKIPVVVARPGLFAWPARAAHNRIPIKGDAMTTDADGCLTKENFFATLVGILFSGALIGVLAAILQKNGNPGNMGICVACFERDIAGALGLHHAAIVQYLRPEILGLGLGAFVAALLCGEWRSRGGSSPLIRFALGIFAALGALIFLGCPWRVMLRLAGGDGNALFGFAGLACGIFLGTLFFRKGYSLGRAKVRHAAVGLIFPLALVALLALRLIFPPLDGQGQNGPLWYSLKGPGSQHAPLYLSLALGLIIGALAQRSRFCTMGALRDIFLFRQFHLFAGVAALVAGAFAANLVLGQFHPGFAGQPVAHTDGLWNFLGMALAGLAFALAGGCPGRQLFAGGEGNADAGIFALGMLAGAAVAHNFAVASSGTGISANGPAAVGIGFAFCLAVGFFYSRKA